MKSHPTRTTERHHVSAASPEPMPTELDTQLLDASVKALIDHARDQGNASLDELRQALDDAGVSGLKAKRILRGLTEAGIKLTVDQSAAGESAEPDGEELEDEDEEPTEQET